MTLYSFNYLVFGLSLLGLLLGSFANVVIHRLPLGQNIAWPGSKCPKCNKPIRWYDNIPILSWVALQGKCRGCKMPISVRYPLVEFVMALCFGITAAVIPPSYFLIEVLILVFGLVVITFIDFDHMIIPNVLSYPGILLGLLGGLLNPERDFLNALIGFLVGGGFFFAIAYIYSVVRKREGLGGGDIKLLAWIGSVLGWISIPYVILVSSILGAVIGISIGLIRKSEKLSDVEIPFGPYISLAALLFIWTNNTPFNTWYQNYLALFGF